MTGMLTGQVTSVKGRESIGLDHINRNCNFCVGFMDNELNKVLVKM
jgi:hypothetical protein